MSFKLQDAAPFARRVVKRGAGPAESVRKSQGSQQEVLAHDDFESHYHSQFWMIVCLCKGVSDRTVRLAIAEGAKSVEAVGARCGAGTDCRSCRHAIQDLVDDAEAVPMACDGCECSTVDSGVSAT